MLLDEDHCFAAVRARDARFDGAFIVAVTSTGIYCRPSCPARTPLRRNLRFFATAAAAHRAGFRACLRCRPDAAPGSPAWDARADVTGRAMRLVADGVVDREGVAGLAARLGYSERQLHRLLTAEVGAGPLALARARRAQTARVLLQTTDLPAAAVAFAAGFASVRQFNDTVREVFARTPTELRRAGARDAGAGDPGAGTLTLRLPARAPLQGAALLAYLAQRAVRGVEEVTPDGTYRRALRLPHAPGVVALRPAADHVEATFALGDLRDLGTAVQRCRRLLDLDADPHAVQAALDDDDVIGPLVRAAPGLRVPGAVDGAEQAVRAVLGQQVSLAGAATLAARLVAAHGEPLAQPAGAVTHLFPTADALAGTDPETLAMPRARRTALLGVAAALADGRLALHPGADRAEAERTLLALPGIGPWTAGYVALRALRDPDAFLPGDLGVRHALERLGQDGAPRAAAALAERWRPYRASALQHLWASLATPRPAVAATEEAA
jgi:AraC family transcriptional regulator of adaptative response / DNA-3-methyladenine glycosylase II